MAAPVLPPAPLESPQGSNAWSRWFQLLRAIVGRVQLADAGPCIVQGEGVPASDFPNGSLYLRTDGGGPNLYVREGGAWVAK